MDGELEKNSDGNNNNSNDDRNDGTNEDKNDESIDKDEYLYPSLPWGLVVLGGMLWCACWENEAVSCRYTNPALVDKDGWQFNLH